MTTGFTEAACWQRTWTSPLPVSGSPPGRAESPVPCPCPSPDFFTVYNALAALSMARLSGISCRTPPVLLAKVPAVPGRMEPVSAPGLGCRIFIDFAHTPEALAQALEALRPMTPGRIIAVFGCGGCRDKGQAPPDGAPPPGNTPT